MKSDTHVAKIYEEIINELQIGDKSKGRLYLDSDRETKRKELSQKYKFFVEHIVQRSYLDFKLSKNIAIYPAKEKPIIKFLLKASISGRVEDRLIAKWMKGKLNCYDPTDFSEVWCLGTILKSRLEALYKAQEIDDEVYYAWKVGFDKMLNLPSVNAIVWMRQNLDTLIDSSRPLRADLNYDEILSLDTDSIQRNREQMQLIILFMKKVLPLMTSQESYLIFIKLFISECIAKAQADSIKVLEFADEKLRVHNDEESDISGQTDTLLANTINWNELLKTSMDHNSSLLPDLCASVTLGEQAKKIAENEFIEKEATWSKQYEEILKK